MSKAGSKVTVGMFNTKAHQSSIGRCRCCHTSDGDLIVLRTVVLSSHLYRDDIRADHQIYCSIGGYRYHRTAAHGFRHDRKTLYAVGHSGCICVCKSLSNAPAYRRRCRWRRPTANSASIKGRHQHSIAQTQRTQPEPGIVRCVPASTIDCQCVGLLLRRDKARRQHFHRNRVVTFIYGNSVYHRNCLHREKQ